MADRGNVWRGRGLDRGGAGGQGRGGSVGNESPRGRGRGGHERGQSVGGSVGYDSPIGQGLGGHERGQSVGGSASYGSPGGRGRGGHQRDQSRGGSASYGSPMGRGRGGHQRDQSQGGFAGYGSPRGRGRGGHQRGQSVGGSVGHDSAMGQGRGGHEGEQSLGGSAGDDSPRGRGRGGHQRGQSRGQSMGYGSPMGRGGGGHQPDQSLGEAGGLDSPRSRGEDGGRGNKQANQNAPKIFETGNPSDLDLNEDVHELEDAVQESFGSKGKSIANTALESPFPFRPGYGTCGEKVTLWSNYFQLTPSGNLTVYRYAVETQPNAKGAKPVGRKLRRIFELLIQQHFGALQDHIATDYKTTLISKSRLDKKDGPLEIIYTAEGNDEPRNTAQRIIVQVANAEALPVSTLVTHLTSTAAGSVYHDKEQIIQALNIILGKHPKSGTEVLSIGANKHFALNQDAVEDFDLGAGLQALRGYFVSVRAAASRLLVNVQVKHAACYHPVGLDVLMTCFLTNSGSSAPLLDLKKFLKGLRIRPTYDEGKDKTGKSSRGVKMITGLAQRTDGSQQPNPPRVPRFGAGPSEVEFFVRPASAAAASAAGPVSPLGELTNLSIGSSGGKGKKPSGKAAGPWGKKFGAASGSTPLENVYISVSKYFWSKHGIELGEVDLPVVNVGSPEAPVYLPPQACEVLPGQPARTELSPAQTAEMIRFAVREPALNATSITTRGAQILGISPNLAPTLQTFDLAIPPTPITVPGRQLSGPKVLYAGQKIANTNDGAWNMQRFEVRITSQQPPNWAYVPVAVLGKRSVLGPGAPLRGKVNEFCAVLASSGINTGITHAGETLSLAGDLGDDDKRIIEEYFDRLLRNELRLGLFLFILPTSDAKMYNYIKFMGDVRKGVHTICVNESKFHGRPNGSNAQYFANVALKFNLKLGGQNHALGTPVLGLIGQGTTMVVGIDVTHPSPGSQSNAPSVAGIVASVDEHLGQWPAQLAIQSARQEMVADLGSLLKSRLYVWRRKRKDSSLPENILVYRDGVSEGQYRIVLDQELPRMKQACQELYPAHQTKRGLPRMTIVVVGKRHHTRFYPTNAKHANPQSNPKSGTVVDRGVTEPRNWDFFLQAHAAITGTARPAHYFVVHDEIFANQRGPLAPPFKNKADVLERLTHNMCYLYGRATKAVSVCPPAYYADLVCERARRYLSSVFAPTATPAGSTAGDDGSSAGSEQPVDPSNVIIHELLRDSMFYI